MRELVIISLWRIAAASALTLGMIGILLPGLPTVPFVLLAAWCASKGWPKLEIWLLQHKTFGQHIKKWRERRVVPLKAKWASTVFMSISCVVIWTSQTNIWLALSISVVLLVVASWIWHLPSK
ncbi:YbaN family protein [Agaribacter flavus]|uniref:Inner membrane protein n=1 Tax=Agaribacter flavus TaxID=1902781 RepID=A0ABV7FUU5_9ALTE